MLSQQVQPVYADRTDCATPGNDGPVTISANNTIVNTYFPGTANANAGNTSITIGGYSGANVGIQPGDLLLVIQMQGANINPNNDNTYGAGTGSGNGNLNDANFTAGQYEYVVATNTVPTAGGTLNINTQLMFSYSTRNFTAGSQGQRRFQVIRVPQYSSLTITAAGTLTAFSWNGNVGGIVAIDVAGALNLTNNATNGNINVNGQGFRGGGGVTGGGRAGLLLPITVRSPQRQMVLKERESRVHRVIFLQEPRSLIRGLHLKVILLTIRQRTPSVARWPVVPLEMPVAVELTLIQLPMIRMQAAEAGGMAVRVEKEGFPGAHTKTQAGSAARLSRLLPIAWFWAGGRRGCNQ